MAMTIGSNNYISTMQNNYMQNAQNTADKALSNISAARAISAGDNAANMTIADSLLSNINGANQGISNINNAIGMMQIADATLSELSTSADKMTQLATRAINGVSMDANGRPILSNDAQKALLSNAQALKTSMQESLNNAVFNGQNVFGGMLNFQAGNNEFSVNLTSPNIASLDIMQPNTIQSFITNLAAQRSNIGSAQQNLAANVNNLAQSVISNTTSEQQLQNNDIVSNINDINSNNMQINATTLTSMHNFSLLQSRLATLLA